MTPPEDSPEGIARHRAAAILAPVRDVWGAILLGAERTGNDQLREQAVRALVDIAEACVRGADRLVPVLHMLDQRPTGHPLDLRTMERIAEGVTWDARNMLTGQKAIADGIILARRLGLPARTVRETVRASARHLLYEDASARQLDDELQALLDTPPRVFPGSDPC